MKKLVALILCFVFCLPTYVLASEETEFTGLVKNQKDIEITITAADGVNINAFVYTVPKEGTSHFRKLHTAEVTRIRAGQSETLTITPPEEGYTKKLIIAESLTLIPLCRAYEYPYMINVYAEPLGYRLTNIGTVIDGDKTYASNEFEIIDFVEAPYEEEISIFSLMMASGRN